MTDQTPRTAAGRNLVKELAEHTVYAAAALPDILAIEAEARTAPVDVAAVAAYERGKAEGLAEARAETEVRVAGLQLVGKAARRVLRNGWNHTNYAGCIDGMPMEGDTSDIDPGVDCDGCQAILSLETALALLSASPVPSALPATSQTEKPAQADALSVGPQSAFLDLRASETVERMAKALHDVEYHPCTGDFTSCDALGGRFVTWREEAERIVAALLDALEAPKP